MPRCVRELISSGVNDLLIFNLEMIDNLILNNLANQNCAPYRLVEKRAKIERELTRDLKPQVHFKQSKNIKPYKSTQN